MFREDEALEIAQEFIEKYKLKITLLGVRGEGDLTTFFFSAPQRVNFRGLSRDLREIFQTEIKFEEAGPREKARCVGGLGRCGMPLCCKMWLSKTPYVPLETLEKAALPTFPEKYTGACGKLLCCLLYENEEGWGATSEEVDSETPDLKSAEKEISAGDGQEKEKESTKSEEKPGKIRKKRVRKLRL